MKSLLAKVQQALDKKISRELRIVLYIIIGIVSFYFANFYPFYKFDIFISNYSSDTGDWGTFGDYVDGILNPIIAGFAFYYVAKTYHLQKDELTNTNLLN